MVLPEQTTKILWVGKIIKTFGSYSLKVVALDSRNMIGLRNNLAVDRLEHLRHVFGIRVVKEKKRKKKRSEGKYICT